MTRTLTLLIQEDEMLICIDHEHIAKHAGWKTCRATLSSDALRVVRKGNVDAAFLDIQINLGKTVNSYDVADELLRRQIPFVFVTGLHPEFIAERFKGVVPVVRKPAMRHELLEVLTRFRKQILRSP